jgi:hypothetical protein
MSPGEGGVRMVQIKTYTSMCHSGQTALPNRNAQVCYVGAHEREHAVGLVWPAWMGPNDAASLGDE